jgi:outer membrane immunogenic protein
MRKVLGLVGATLLFAGPALAADLAVKAPRALPLAPVFSWSGCYVGGFVGGASGTSVNASELQAPAGFFYNITGTPYSYSTGGSVIGGGTVGCNWQPMVGNPLVLGVEGEVGYLHSTGSVADPNGSIFAFDTIDRTTVGDWYGVIAGRLGFANGPWLFYAKGGAAFTHVSSSVVDACNVAPCGGALINATGSSSPVGAAVGGGIEYALSDHWTVKAEYLWLGINTSFAVCGTASTGNSFCSAHSISNGISTGKVGLNFKF